MSTGHNLADAFLKLIETPDLPNLGPEVRACAKPPAELDTMLDGFFGEHGVMNTLKPLLRSAALLWHDRLDESHTISQSISGADGSFLHGIMHRREPDYSNAKYWFHRVGQHPAFPAIAEHAITVLNEASNSSIQAQLIAQGNWDSIAFVDACESASAKGKNDPDYKLMQALQQVEFETLVDHLVGQS